MPLSKLYIPFSSTCKNSSWQQEEESIYIYVLADSKVLQLMEKTIKIEKN
jgi:hypothetical protein